MKNVKKVLDSNSNNYHLIMNTFNIFQRPRAAAEISPVNECRQIKVEFDPTSKVSKQYS